MLKALSRVKKSFNRPLIANFSLSGNLPGLTTEQLQKIENSDHFLRNRHYTIEGTLNEEDKLVARRKRMIYRSKQRGWLEADILMGSWATENVPTLSESELDDYDTILKEETIDVFNYITGKDQLPDHLKNLTVMKKLQEYAFSSHLYYPKDYEAIKIKSNLT